MKKPIYYYDIVQGTDDWQEIRKGKITGSVFKTLMVNGKGPGGLGAGAITQLYRVAEERITGKVRQSFKGNKATDWGHEYEQEAMEYYEHENFVKIKTVGFVERSEWTGVSPDGLIDEDGGIEIKCFPTKHMQILETKKYGDEEYTQCQVNMWVTGRKYWDLCYYHPDFPEHSKLIKYRLYPDKERFITFEKREQIFINEVSKKVKFHLNK